MSKTKTVESNSAQYAFLYFLSLVALIFTATSIGSIIFQIINKYVVDILSNYGNSFQIGAVQFAISAIIIAAPIYYITTNFIQKALYKGELDEKSGIRRWLSYLILLIASIIILGYLIGILNSFFQGELTNKFILKAITAILISGMAFDFYFYDINRKKVVGKKNKWIKTFFWISLVVIIITLMSAFIFVFESPSKIRDRRIDDRNSERLGKIDNAVNNYYDIEKKMPNNLDELLNRFDYMEIEDFENIQNGKNFQYKVTGDNLYQICTEFLVDYKEIDQNQRGFGGFYKHPAGQHCFNKEVFERLDNGMFYPEKMRIIE